ncbi:uncharacterized protein LOC135431778 isoform X17 [Drosophila montana]|uniref:uncharacterized protein LOC135431778 isoform X17 n=1 Tax=Drosophila montana TaxID=40370 RepID=UPI00313D7BFF
MPADVTLYIVYFILVVILCILVRLCCVCAMRKPVVDQPPLPLSQSQRGRGPPRVLRQIRIDPSGTTTEVVAVRDYLDCQMLLSSRRQWQQPAKSPK